MKCVTLGFHGSTHYVRTVQVRLDRTRAYAYLERLIRLEAMQGKSIFLGEDTNRTDTQLFCCAYDPDGDLAPVGDEYPFEIVFGITQESSIHATERCLSYRSIRSKQ